MTHLAWCGWKDGQFSKRIRHHKFAVVGNLVMLAQPSLFVQKTAELFVSSWSRVLERQLQCPQQEPSLNDGNLAWTTF